MSGVRLEINMVMGKGSSKTTEFHPRGKLDFKIDGAIFERSINFEINI